MLGRTLLMFVGSVVVIGLGAFLIIKLVQGTKKRDDVNNVVDLRDCFNRARYMEEDGR